ncbi:MAG: hypothetical protein Q9193_005777 [Seirophora villosa]
MASLHDVIAELGYTVDQPRRGYPSALSEDMRLFSRSWSGIQEMDELSDLYLCERGTVMFKPHQRYPSYPGDRDRITSLISQAFDNLRLGTSDTTPPFPKPYAEKASSMIAAESDYVPVGGKGADDAESAAEPMNQQSDTMMEVDR